MTINAVIFDSNGVLLKSEYLSSRLERDYGVKDADVVAAITDIMPKIRLPEAPKAWDFWKPYIKNWGLDFTEESFFAYWFSGEGLNQELFDYAKELKEQGKKIFILSNNFKERRDYYKKELGELFDLVDKAYFSRDTGFVKPDKQAWQLVLDEFSLNPKTCVYVDDSTTNVASAQSLGIIAAKYQGVGALRKLILDN